MSPHGKNTNGPASANPIVERARKMRATEIASPAIDTTKSFQRYGNKVIEIRQQGMDKGVTASKMVKLFKPAFTLCLGDDTTDEDMFLAMNTQAVTIKIGSSTTAAQYNIRSQTDVAPFLQQLIKSSIKKTDVYSQI